MTKLKLSAIPDDRPVKITVALPASVFRDLQFYSEASPIPIVAHRSLRGYVSSSSGTAKL